MKAADFENMYGSKQSASPLFSFSMLEMHLPDDFSALPLNRTEETRILFFTEGHGEFLADTLRCTVIPGDIGSGNAALLHTFHICTLTDRK